MAKAQKKGVVIAAAGSSDADVALREGKRAVIVDQVKGIHNIYLGWWWMGKQMGAAIRPHSVLDAIPHDGFLTPFFFRIIGEGRRLPIPGIAEEDILMAGEGGDACCCYVAQKRLSNGNSTFYVWGLDILSDQPEAVALLNTLVDAD